jgi:hypothetical protein
MTQQRISLLSAIRTATHIEIGISLPDDTLYTAVSRAHALRIAPELIEGWGARYAAPVDDCGTDAWFADDTAGNTIWIYWPETREIRIG